MKCYFTIILTNLIILFSTPILHAQESTKNVAVHFNDGKVITGDIILFDYSLGIFDLVSTTRETYQISDIQYFENANIIVRRFTFDEKDNLYIAVVEGEKISLYKTEEFNKKIFYVYKNGEIHKLEGGKIEFEKEGKKYRKDNTRYKGTLRVLLDSNANLVKKINKINYTEKDLSDIIISYNDGQVSYVNSKSRMKSKDKSLSYYAQYSNEISHTILSNPNATPYFFGVGTKLKFDKASRHSLKFGLEYGKYTNSLYELDNYNVLSFSFSYLFDFYRMPHSNFYLGLRIFDVSYVNTLHDKYFLLIPRLTPSIGFEYHINQKLDTYIELNHLLTFKQLPYNFSVGLAYNF